MAKRTHRAAILALMNAIEALLLEHGFLSDPDCVPVPCECRACEDARALLAELAGEI